MRLIAHLDLSSSETVDRLLFIPNHEELVLAPDARPHGVLRQPQDLTPLESIGVLELVHHDISELSLVELTYGCPIQDPGGVDLQICEIEGAPVQLGLLISLDRVSDQMRQGTEISQRLPFERFIP